MFIYAGLDDSACECLTQLPLLKPLNKVTANIYLTVGILGFTFAMTCLGNLIDRCINGYDNKVEQEILREIEMKEQVRENKKWNKIVHATVT
jgi:hypothetical protein